MEEPSRTVAAQVRIEQLLAQRAAARKPALPGWVSLAMRLLPYTLVTVTVLNGLIGALAVLTPYIAAWSSGAGDAISAAYALICPQRPSHTFFLNGHPMAFEQRDLSMHLGFTAAGLLYALTRWLERPLPGWALAAGVAPMVVDVTLSTFGFLPSTWLSRTWTGALAAFVIVWWTYPRFDGYLAGVRRHVVGLSS